MAKSGSQRLKEHIERSGGRRVSVVLYSRSIVALDYLREDRGLQSDTEAINYALQRAAAENLSIKE